MNTKVFVIYCILFDMLTTVLGLSLGLTESNPLGFSFILFLNIIAMLFFYYMKNDKVNKYVNTALFILGSSRLLVGFWNLFNIIMVLVIR